MVSIVSGYDLNRYDSVDVDNVTAGVKESSRFVTMINIYSFQGLVVL